MASVLLFKGALRQFYYNQGPDRSGFPKNPQDSSKSRSMAWKLTRYLPVAFICAG